MFRKLILAGALATIVATPALSADMPTKAPVMASPVYNWTGFYVGADLGGLWSRSSDAITPAGSTAHPKPHGINGGAHLGYLWQMPSRLVLGLEADIWAANADGFSNYPPFVNDSKLEVNWGGSVRGTVGYAFNQWLPYVTGGVAFADTQGCVTVGGARTCAAGFNYDQDRVGWTLGVGLAYALTPRWSVRAEYLFSDYGRKTTTDTGSNQTHRVDLETNVARVGLSYKF